MQGYRVVGRLFITFSTVDLLLPSLLISTTRLRLLLHLTSDSTGHTRTQYTHHFNIYSETLDYHLLTSCHLQKHTDTECTVNAAVLLHTYHNIFPIHLHGEKGQVSHSSCALHTNNCLVQGTATSLVGWRRGWPQWKGATISFPVLTPISVTQ